METALGVFVSILLLIVATWIAIFGGIGALLSRSRGGSVPAGLAWGTGLGPLGWLAILWTTRKDRIAPEEALPLTEPNSTKPAPRPAAADQWDPWNK